jgi:hypothetical protein
VRQNHSKQDAAEIVDVAVKVAKALPCPMAMKIIIGPATAGRAPSRIAIEESRLRPASVTRRMNIGTKVSLKISIVRLYGNVSIK